MFLKAVGFAKQPLNKEQNSELKVFFSRLSQELRTHQNEIDRRSLVLLTESAVSDPSKAKRIIELAKESKSAIDVVKTFLNENSQIDFTTIKALGNRNNNRLDEETSISPRQVKFRRALDQIHAQHVMEQLKPGIQQRTRQELPSKT